MASEQLMHFAVSDDSIQCHVTCTKYTLANGSTTYRVSYSSQFYGRAVVPLSVIMSEHVIDAMYAAAAIRDEFRETVLKLM